MVTSSVPSSLVTAIYTCQIKRRKNCIHYSGVFIDQFVCKSSKNGFGKNFAVSCLKANEKYDYYDKCYIILIAWQILSF